MSSAINLSLIGKLLTTAGHPGTSDPEALNAARKAYKLVDAAGKDFDAVLKPSGAQSWQRESDLLAEISQLRSKYSTERNHYLRAHDEIVEQGKKITKLNAKLRKVQRENNDLWAQLDEVADFADAVIELLEKNAELDAEVQEATRVSGEQAARIEALLTEIAELKTRNSGPESSGSEQTSSQQQEREPVSRIDNPFETGSASQASGSNAATGLAVQELIAALDVLRKVDPNMRIKTALTYLHTVANDGLSVSDVTGRVGQVSVGSIRYAMRNLGQGWPRKRMGMALIEECSNADGSRARLYVASGRGRQIFSGLQAALQTASKERTERPDFKMAA